MVKELSDKFGIKDREALKKIASSFIGKVKSQTFESPTRVAGMSSRKKVDEPADPTEKIKEELLQEKEKNSKLQQDYDKLVQEYDQIAMKGIPNFEELKEKIIYDTIAKEREKHEKEKSFILKDLQKRVDKVYSLIILSN